MGNRKVLEVKAGGVGFNAHVFDGSNESVCGEIVFCVTTRSGTATSETRMYCRAEDFRRMAAELVAAAESVESVEGRGIQYADKYNAKAAA